MASELSHPEQVAVRRLRALLELLPTAFDQRLSDVGVTAFEHTVLETLAEADGKRARLSEVARRTNATLPRLSRVATALQRRGLIDRVPCEADGRATNAVITVRGEELLAESSRAYDAAVRELLLPGLGTLQGDGAIQLADVSYAILESLDPQAAIEAREREPKTRCAADPVGDPPGGTTEESVRTCPADPAG